MILEEANAKKPRLPIKRNDSAVLVVGFGCSGLEARAHTLPHICMLDSFTTSEFNIYPIKHIQFVAIGMLHVVSLVVPGASSGTPMKHSGSSHPDLGTLRS